MRVKWIVNLFLVLLIAVLVAGCNQSGNEVESNNEQSDDSKSAEEWPTDNVKLIIPYSAGGAVDFNGRAFTAIAAKYTDHSFTVENVGGGGGTVGNHELVQANPDGKTILLGASSHLASSLHVIDTSYTMDDYSIINKLGFLASILVAPEDSPFSTLEEVVDYAKENPGDLNVANPGEGTVASLLSRYLFEELEIEVTHVPFDGSGPLVAGIMGGHVDLALMNTPDVQSQIDSGSLVGLAVLSEDRVEGVKDVPTVEEQGFPAVTGGAEHYFIAPKDTPEPLRKAMDEFIKEIYADEEFQEMIANSGFNLQYKDQEESKSELLEWYNIAEDIYRLTGDIE